MGEVGEFGATSSELLKRFHRAADDLATGALRVPRLYRDGFGNRQNLLRVVEQIRDYDCSLASPPIELVWTTSERFALRAQRKTGWFRSPTAHIDLPPESRVAHVEAIWPHRSPRGVVLHLAASGEVGFLARRELARALLRYGYASLILENPFYGLRKPHGQQHAALRTVSEQFAMNFATVEEGRALLHWLRTQGHRRIGVTGYSQGGVMAAFCAALSRFPVAVCPRGAADSVANLFTRDNFSRVILWQRLSEDVGGELEARRIFRHALEVVTVSRFPPPVRPEAAVMLSGRHDRFVDPAQAEALHAHWPGSELRWMGAGHVTGLVLRLPSHIRAIRDAMARLG
ncbi:MAG: alpha/beta hydrolase family protein [Myxococcota bacterium]